MTPDRAHRTERLAPFFEAQLLLARRMAELTGGRLSDFAFSHTHLYRRLGFEALTSAGPGAGWLAYATALDSTADLAGQVALTQAVFLRAQDETWPLPGQAGFGCFAHEPPASDGGVKIHFYNLDTDEAGGPLAREKRSRRHADLAAIVRNIAEAHPEATSIRGRSWLYNLEAYRRLFPPDYAASRAPAPGPLRLTGTSSWGQLIDSREVIRPDVRDAFVAGLADLDVGKAWTAFPFPQLVVSAPLGVFLRHFKL